MTVKELCEKFNLTPVVLSDPEKEVTGGYTGDLLSWVMSRAEKGDAWITIMSNINIVAVASITDAACIILTEGEKPNTETVNIAKARNINILTTDKTSFEISGEISAAL